MLKAWARDQSCPSNDQDWSVWLEATIRRVMHNNTRLTREKKHTQGAHVRTHAKKIQLAEIQLQRDPSNVEVRNILSNAQGKLAEVFQDSVARNRHFSSAKRLRYGDTCSKAFFDFHRIGKKKVLLRELETESGIVMGQRNLTHYITDYYTRMYTSDFRDLGTTEAQEQC